MGREFEPNILQVIIIFILDCFYLKFLFLFFSLTNGILRVFYDPSISTKGALLSAGKAYRRKADPSDFAIVGEIINPHALPMYRVRDFFLNVPFTICKK